MTIDKLAIKCFLVASLISILIFETACSLGQTAAVSPCYRDRIQTSPGLYLPMSSGRIFQVYPTGNLISMNWRPLDKVIVCPIGGGAVEIVNVTEKGEQVKAIQILNDFP